LGTLPEGELNCQAEDGGTSRFTRRKAIAPYCRYHRHDPIGEQHATNCQKNFLDLYLLDFTYSIYIYSVFFPDNLTKLASGYFMARFFLMFALARPTNHACDTTGELRLGERWAVKGCVANCYEDAQMDVELSQAAGAFAVEVGAVAVQPDEACEVSIIVPTYCEADNLPTLIPRISAVLEEAEICGEILVVDDNSPDSTEQVCDALAMEYPVRLIVRRNERGLSSAVIEGMRQARGAVLLVMDADLSHPPEKIPELVRAVQSDGADFAIGSRYVAGGGTDETWGLFRWLNSKAATLLARPLTSARDPMAGFFALNRAKFQSATHLNPVGYKIGLELIIKCGCRRIAEVPIFFGNRLRGESKLSLKEQFNYIRHLKRLYEYKLGVAAQPVQFVLIGATGMVVDLTTFTLLMCLMPANVGRALAIWIAMTWNFWLNRRLTFSDARHRPIVRQYVLFCMSCALGAFLSWSVFAGLHSAVAIFAERPIIAALVGIVVGTVSNFVLSKYVAFK